MIQHFKRNTAGRDFAVGDIHGCFRLLQQTLKDIGFDETTDRLFSVGDLVDRGPDSEDVRDWIEKPWFHAVRGNHEQMAIDVAAGRHEHANYQANGGAWFLRLPVERQRLVAECLNLLPLGIDVETQHGKVGIVHADIPTTTWAAFAAAASVKQSTSEARRFSKATLWSRARITRHEDQGSIPDLHALVVGHTPVANPVRLGNVCYIDTGAVFMGGRLTIADLDQILCTPRRAKY